MTTKTMYYRGYAARSEYSEEDGIFCGMILGIRDMICFHSEESEGMEESFHQAVDDYLALCAEIGKEPEKPKMEAEN